LTVTMQIESVSPEKKTGLGDGHFITQLLTYRDQDDAVVAEMRFRLLKFKPPAKREPAAPKFPRPRPGITHDGQFWWDGMQQGKLLIQRCVGCRALRHPPGPMCPKCQSLEWDTVEASGRGRVYSFVVFHHPPIPGFEYPNVIALIELEEGVRLVSNLEGVSREEARIGMPVQGKVTEVEDGYFLPQFHPAER
ncbi:MAG: Zn-ribbon domain-containing OB-fold protein, partial [Myxococcota bacterium]